MTLVEVLSEVIAGQGCVYAEVSFAEDPKAEDSPQVQCKMTYSDGKRYTDLTPKVVFWKLSTTGEWYTLPTAPVTDSWAIRVDKAALTRP